MVPKHLIETRRTVGQMQVGESAYTWGACMAVDHDGHCFIEPNAKTMDAPNILSSIRVERREDGYHVAVVVPGTTWSPHSQNTSLTGEEMIPVVSFREEYLPEEE